MLKQTLTICAVAILAISQMAYTQTFTDINAGLTAAEESSGGWGDYDNDGDLDILLINGGSFAFSKIYRNDGNAVFTDINAGLTVFYHGSGAWGDYDNDGDLDILLTGREVGTNAKISVIHRNDGNNVFTDINAGLAGGIYGSASWDDYDNDGDLDVFVSGDSNSVIISKMYRNDSNNVFTEVNGGITGAYYSASAAGDYDNDGDLDILQYRNFNVSCQ